MATPTPQYILDEDQRDVFEEIVPSSSTYYGKKRIALWNRFRYRGIGHPDIDYWCACMRSRYLEIEARYDFQFQAMNEFQLRLQQDGIDFTNSGFESETIPDLVTENEDFPDTAAGTSSSYLTNKTKNTGKSTSRGTSYGGTQTARVRNWMDSVHDPAETFAREFDDLFSWRMR